MTGRRRRTSSRARTTRTSRGHAHLGKRRGVESPYYLFYLAYSFPPAALHRRRPRKFNLRARVGGRRVGFRARYRPANCVSMFCQILTIVMKSEQRDQFKVIN